MGGLKMAKIKPNEPCLLTCIFGGKVRETHTGLLQVLQSKKTYLKRQPQYNGWVLQIRSSAEAILNVPILTKKLARENIL